jgi:hypothetical protein
LSPLHVGGGVVVMTASDVVVGMTVVGMIVLSGNTPVPDCVVVPGAGVVVSPVPVVVSPIFSVVVSAGVVSTGALGVVDGQVGYLPQRPLTRSIPDSAQEHSSMLQSSMGKQSPSFPQPNVQLHFSGQVFGGIVTS